MTKFSLVAASPVTGYAFAGVVKVTALSSSADISVALERNNPPHTSSAYSTPLPAGIFKIAAEPFSL